MNNRSDDYKTWLKREKRSFTTIPLIISLLCTVAICVTGIKAGWDGVLNLFTKDNGYFLTLFLSGIVLFPLMHFVLWLGIKYLEPNAPETKFSEIDPIARILIAIVKISLCQ